MQWNRALQAPGRPAARLRATDTGGADLVSILKVSGVIVVCAAAALLWAGSRMDLVEISGSLGQARTQLTQARAEHERLELELASLRDPVRLEGAAQALQLDVPVPVVEVELAN